MEIKEKTTVKDYLNKTVVDFESEDEKKKPMKIPTWVAGKKVLQ